MWWPYVLAGFVGLMILIIIIRTLTFKAKDFPEMRKKHEFDKVRAIESLSQMIQFKTVSNIDESKVDKKAFKAFRQYLRERYPKINEVATYSEHEAGVLFHIKGMSDEQPSVLMSHYDVVPVTEGWQEDPFSGRVDEQTIYGRGTLDTKNSLCVIMEAVEYALNQGKTFKNDLYLAFGGDEEISGPSAPAIRDHLHKQGIKPAFVLDEGGAIISKMFPGVKQKAAVIGISEKGYMDVSLTARSRGGHASSPPKETALTELAKAVRRLNNHRAFKMKLTAPVKALFKTLPPHSKSFGVKMLFANLWLFMPVVKMMAKKSGGEFASMFKTTQAFTVASGSDAYNVLPSEASLGVNYRLRPFESSDTVLKRIRKIIKNPNIEVKPLKISEATSVSLIDEQFGILAKAIKQTWPDVLTTPYLMVATTDSRHYHAISDHVYKFSPMDVSRDDLRKIHGFDEDITIDNVINGVNFYLNLIEQL